jgi:ABC-type taurine transport system substrate-binding protein
MTTVSPELPAQLQQGYQWLTLQEATPEVITALVALHADAFADYNKNPADLQKIAPSAAEAAMVLVANTMLNLDSALTR